MGRRQRPAASKKPLLRCHEMTTGSFYKSNTYLSDADTLSAFFVKEGCLKTW